MRLTQKKLQTWTSHKTIYRRMSSSSFASNLTAKQNNEPRHVITPSRNRPRDGPDLLLIENGFRALCSKLSLMSKSQFIASRLQVEKFMR